MAKWIEFEDYRKSLKGAFVRVIYKKKYVVAMIEKFEQGEESYKLE